MRGLFFGTNRENLFGGDGKGGGEDDRKDLEAKLFVIKKINGLHV